MANVHRMEPANVSGAGIVFGVFAALVCHIMLNLLGLGLGLLAVDTNADTQQGGWVAFAWWAVSGIVSSFVGGWVAGWMAGAVDGSPGFHGLATWAISTVFLLTAAGFITVGGAFGLPGIAGAPGATDVTAAEVESAAAVAGAIALASFIALSIGAVTAYIGAQMGAEREVRLHPHMERRI